MSDAVLGSAFSGAAAELASTFRATRLRQPAVSALTATAASYVAVGSTTLLGTPPRDVPTAWLADDLDGPWREIRLPIPLSGTGAAQADAISCAANHCAIAGRDGADVLTWRLTLAEGQASLVGAPVPVGSVMADNAGIGVAAGNGAHDWVAVTEGGVHVFRVSSTRATSDFETPGTLTAMSRGSDGRPFIAVVGPSGSTELRRGP